MLEGGYDLNALARHRVSVTPVTVDLTHYGSVRMLRQVFNTKVKSRRTARIKTGGAGRT